MSNEIVLTSNETRAKLENISQVLLRLHKALLDDERIIYEMEHGQATSPHALFQLVLNHSQFSWLGKFSSLIVLIDEATSVRRPVPEATSQSLLVEARGLLTMEAGEESFVTQFQNAIHRSTQVKDLYAKALKIATE